MALVLPITVLSSVSACATSPERLPELDRQFYYNLESDKEREEFLELKAAERQAFLEQAGLWDRWTELTAEEREGVANHEVKVGFKRFAAHMAWGPPADTREEAAGERKVKFETFIRCTSGPKAGRYVRNNVDCDGTSSEVRLAIEEGAVTEIKYLD